MKKKLLIINGAGASIDFGMPSVKKIDLLFNGWANDLFKLENNPKSNLYEWIKEKYNNYFKDRNLINNGDNFENYLYIMSLLESALSKSDHWLYFSNRLKTFIKEFEELPSIETFGNKFKIAESHDFHFLQSYLIDKLIEHFRVLCKGLEHLYQDEQNLLKYFYKELQDEFDIGVFNLNYDNVIIRNIPKLNTGFSNDTNQLERESLHSSDWGFCYHVHGSVHFDMIGGKDNTQMHKVNWNPDLSSQFSQNSSGRNSNYTSEGTNSLMSSIIAGLGKTNQILREPFIQYYMTLDRRIYEADAILFIGYGFSDIHFNSLFEFIRFDENKTRKVVILDYADYDAPAFQERNDSWKNGISQTVPFNHYEIERPLCFDVNDFKKNESFEKNSNHEHPISIWYNGFLEACKNPKLIIKELI